MVIEQVLTSQTVKKAPQPDDRKANRIHAKESFHERALQGFLGIIGVHIHLAADDIALFFPLLFRENRMQCDLHEAVHKILPMTGRPINLENRVARTGAGVPHPAASSHVLTELRSVHFGCPLEHHVLGEM